MAMLRTMILGLLALLGAPGLALAQAAQCSIPPALSEPRAEPVPDGGSHPGAVTGYLLALSWSPDFCKMHPGPEQAEQCGGPTKFGFILHGLWPEGAGRGGPEWCKPVAALPRDLVRRNFCATPSVRLQQHEWARHGSCISDDPARYFRYGTALFSALAWPEMNSLSKSRPSVGGFVAALVRVNPGLRAEMFSVVASRGGWLEEVRLCLGPDFHARACPAGTTGASASQPLKIWRAEK
jgi:ribonuclease T2